jgi:subtilisin family serine protease
MLSFALLTGLVSAAAAQSLTAQGAEDRLIIGYKEGVSAAEQHRIAESQGLTVLREIPELRVLLVKAPLGRAGILSETLRVNPAVFDVEKDVWRNWLESEPSFQNTPFGLPAAALKAVKAARVPMTPKLDNGEVPWGVARVNAPSAWGSNQGANVKVAVIDTGIDPEQPDLKSKVAGGYNALDKNASWADDHFHGTHVAGTIAAAMDDKGVVGVAPKATLYAVKVLSKEGSGSMFSIMDGIMWTARNGIQVANMSLGAPQEIPLLQYAIQMATKAGVVIVAAAGNDGKAVNWPAAYPETIAVAALCPTGVTNTKLCPNTNEGISTFSSRGPQIAFIAPGVLIPSTVPLAHDASGVKAYSGTSMACPHVAGLAALAVAKNGGKRMKTADVRAILAGAATKLPGLTAEEQGNGLIDAGKLR